MVRVARIRISDLFSLAEREAMSGSPELADRYVALARRIGMRYNVRLPSEYRDLYCRACSTFWVEGRSVRTRLRSGRRVRTCLRCGAARRASVRPPTTRRGPDAGDPRPGVAREEGALAELLPEQEVELGDEESEEE